MKKLIISLAAAVVTFSLCAQDGTISFHNRNLSPMTPGGSPYHVPIAITDPATARAQLYLVTGSGASPTYTPLSPLQTFRTTAPTEFFNAPVLVSVTGKAPGTTGLRFVVRAWEGAATYETATTRGESPMIVVWAPLGGTTAEGVTYDPPDLGGPNGLQWGVLTPPPLLQFDSIKIEGGNVRFDVFASLVGSSTNYSLDITTNFVNWTPVMTNSAAPASVTLPLTLSSRAQFFRMRTPPSPTVNTFGTIIFHNRNLSSPTPGGSVYHASISLGTTNSPRYAQLVLVSGNGASATFTPLLPIQTFRTNEPIEYFTGPVTVEVTGQVPGTTELHFVVRAWYGAATYEAARTTAGGRAGESSMITIHRPLGGTTASGLTYESPDLGGPDGLQPFELVGF